MTDLTDSVRMRVVVTESEYEMLKVLASEDDRPIAVYLRRLMQEYVNNPNLINFKGKHKKLKRSEEDKKSLGIQVPNKLKEDFQGIAKANKTMAITVLRLMIQLKSGKTLPHYLVNQP
jgi:predicted DNA-binding protein